MIKSEFLHIKLAYLNVSNPNWAVYLLTFLIVSNASVDWDVSPLYTKLPGTWTVGYTPPNKYMMLLTSLHWGWFSPDFMAVKLRLNIIISTAGVSRVSCKVVENFKLKSKLDDEIHQIRFGTRASPNRIINQQWFNEFFSRAFFQNCFLTAYKHMILEKIVKSLLRDNFGEIPATVWRVFYIAMQ